MSARAAVQPRRRVRRAALRLSELLLLLRRHARGRVRRREPGAAGAPRGRGASAPSRWPAPPAAAPTRRSTTTSASGCCTAPRTSTSTASWCATIERSLDPLSVWVAAAEEPALVKVANIQHLATPVRAQLAEPAERRRAGGRAAPDVRGRRRAVDARRAARARAGAASTAAGTRRRSAGWTPPRTASSASRCAARCSQGRTAHCYAGVGVVADSDPEAELAETEVKLQAIVPALTGA